jgi:L-threonylcarbamoyladenylate synthase
MTKISEACKILNNGGVVGMPTETVYGLAASIDNSHGIENIFKTKERPFFDPLIVHVNSIQQARAQASQWYPICDILAESFWPGPMTLILPKADHISSMITSGLDTVGIRMPSHSIASELIEQLGKPVAAPSANKFKKTSPTTAAHVQSEFPEIMVLDGGQCEIGIESTVLGVEEDKIKIYRPGMLTKSILESILRKHNLDIKIEYTESPVAPGHLKHHYMPNLPIITLWGSANYLDEAIITEIPEGILKNLNTWVLPTDANLAARNLYQKFRELDTKQATAIVLVLDKKLKEKEEWLGILNRIKKATTFFLTE